MMNSVVTEARYLQKTPTIKMTPKPMPYMKPLIKEWTKNVKNTERNASKLN